MVEGCCLTIKGMEGSQLYLCPSVDYLDCLPLVFDSAMYLTCPSRTLLIKLNLVVLSL